MIFSHEWIYQIEEVEDLIEEEELDEEEELEYENGSDEDNEAKQKDEFNPSNNKTSTISSIWKSRFTGAWDNWTIVPTEDKEIWFNSFKEKYPWDAKINTKDRSLFNTLGSKSLRDYITRMRIKGRAHKPPFMHQTVWDALWIIWESPEFIAKSDRRRAARQSNKRLHVAGSVLIAEHKRRLQKELGRDPTAAELFFRTHIKKDMKTFIDSEAKETWTSQNHEMVQLREMLDCQKIQYDLLKAKQERMKTTQEAHTEKLD
nr:hypothetical protein [Tanacetum cinerariifolium]